MKLMMFGAIAMASFTISLFFLHFWKKTRDRFFLLFSISFALEGVIRIMLASNSYADEQEPLIYLIRLVAYLLIIFAIVDKNRSKKRKASE